MYEVYNVTGAIVNRDECVIGLVDQRYNSVMVIKPVINEDTGKAEFEVSEPDGAERIYWLEKLGLITEEEFNTEVEKFTQSDERKKLYELLKVEIEGRE